MSKFSAERINLKNLQSYHHKYLNNFDEEETLPESIANRPGFCAINPIMFLSILARKAIFDLSDLDELLIHDKLLLRVPAFRGMLSLVNTIDYPIYFRSFYSLLLPRNMDKINEAGINKPELNEIAKKIKDINFEKPFSLQDLKEAIFFAYKSDLEIAKISLIMQKLCDMGILIRVHAKGWKGNDFSYMLMEKWLENFSLQKIDNPEIAKTETIRKYLKCYGPASINDIVYWTGLSLIDCQKSLLNLKKETVRIHIDGYKENMIGLKESLDIMKKKNSCKEEVCMLPSWDIYTSAWACQKRLIDNDLLPYAFDDKGNAANVIVHMGKIIGLWQFREQEVGHLEFHIFDKYQEYKNSVLYKIHDLSQSLRLVSKLSIVNISEKNLPSQPLNKREEKAFLWPLGKNTVKSEQEVNLPKIRSSNILKQPYLDNNYLVTSLK